MIPEHPTDDEWRWFRDEFEPEARGQRVTAARLIQSHDNEHQHFTDG